MSADEIVDYCLLPMLTEALRCLDEQVVTDAEHLDAAFVYGIGFPPFRGGLLHYFASIDRTTLAQKFEAQQLPVPENLELIYAV